MLKVESSLKKFLFLVLSCIISSQVYADTGSRFENIFYSLVIKRTNVKNKSNALIGFRSGWIMNDSYSVGVGIYELINKILSHVTTDY